MREQLLRIANDVDGELPQSLSEDTFNFLRGEMNNSQHGQRFQSRDLTLKGTQQRKSPFDVSYPYVVANETDQVTRNYVADNMKKLLMPDDNWINLVEGFKAVYQHPEVEKHRSMGGSVIFLSNHSTYADIPESIVTSAQARTALGEENPQFTQDIIIHRIISLFRLKLIEQLFALDNNVTLVSDGALLEDVLLHYSNALQTLPNTASGRSKFVENVRDGRSTRKEINTRPNQIFYKLIKLGGRVMFIAGAGTETKPDENDQLVEGRVAPGTISWLTKSNKPSEGTGGEQIMTIPFFIHADPFVEGDIPLQPVETPFVFLSPRFLHQSRDVHNAMEEVTYVGNEYKPSGSPVCRYDNPIPGWALKKTERPEIIFASS